MDEFLDKYRGTGRLSNRGDDLDRSTNIDQVGMGAEGEKMCIIDGKNGLDKSDMYGGIGGMEGEGMESG